MTRYNFNFKPTQFHAGVGKLLDKESAQELISELGKKYELNVDPENLVFKSPSLKYMKYLKEDDIERVKTYSHLVTISYGKRPSWLLWLTTIDGLQYSFYVNPITQQVIWCKHRFAAWLYKGTVFEGELIRDSYVISDLLVYKNEWYQENLHIKLSVIKELLIHHYISDPLIENVKLELKPFVTYQYIKSFVVNVVNQDEESQGLLFVPVDKSYKIYSVLFRYSDQLQLTPNIPRLEDDDLTPVEIIEEDLPKDDDYRNSEQVFWLASDRNINDNYYLYSINRDTLIRHDLVVLTSLEKASWIKEVFHTNEGRKHSGIGPLLQFQCRFVKKFQRWEPIDLIKT